TGPSPTSTTPRASTWATSPAQPSLRSPRSWAAAAATAVSARSPAIATTPGSRRRCRARCSGPLPRAASPWRAPSGRRMLLALEMRAASAQGRSVDAREATVAELVSAAHGGNRAAFASLYERFHRVVHAIALARIPACDAGDVVQDVFADVWIKVTRLREPAAFPGWILTMARN